MSTNNDNNETNNTTLAELRKPLYSEIERILNTKFLSFVTSDRQGMEAIIQSDCIDPFADILDQISPTEDITLMLYTLGGDTLVAWRLINLIRMYCKKLTVVVFSKALSAGTLIAIGADKILMTRQAVLGPIDPSIVDPLNPKAETNGQLRPVQVSVESVRGYLDAAREELKITDSEKLTSVLIDLTTHIHPLVLGSVFRTQSQIRFLARKLLSRHIDNTTKIESIISFMCADSGSHDYTMNRTEAIGLGLQVEEPSEEAYLILLNIHRSFMDELQVRVPFSPHTILRSFDTLNTVPYSNKRVIIESAEGAYNYLSEGILRLIETPEQPISRGVFDERTFDGWRHTT